MSKINIDVSKYTKCEKAKKINLIDIKQSEKTFHQLIKEWLNYFQNCGFKEGDERHHNLSGILQTLIWVNSQVVYHVNEVNSNGQSIANILKNLGDKNMCAFLDQFNLLNMLGFITILNFQLEIMCKGLIDELKITPKENDFYWIV